MFNSISWTDFIVTIALIGAAYYTVLGVFMYQSEIAGWFRRSNHKQAAPTEAPAPSPDTQDNLLGKIRRPPAATSDEFIEEADAVQFSDHRSEKKASETIDTFHGATDDSLIIGKVSDLLEEAKTLASLFQDEKASREDIATLFRALLEKYAPLKNSRYTVTINLFLHDLCKDACSFELHPDEIRSWWPGTTPN